MTKFMHQQTDLFDERALGRWESEGGGVGVVARREQNAVVRLQANDDIDVPTAEIPWPRSPERSQSRNRRQSVPSLASLT